MLFLTVGWTTGAIIVSRSLERWSAADAILFGSCLMVPAVTFAGFGVALSWPIALIFGGFFLMGVSIGFVSTSGLTLLQSSAADREMGRVNSAHQFVRTLCITYGVAVGGAILLLVVDNQTGDVEAVRDALGGNDVTASAVTLGAVRDGLAWIHVFSGLAAIACVTAAAQLWRNSRARAQ